MTNNSGSVHQQFQITSAYQNERKEVASVQYAQTRQNMDKMLGILSQMPQTSKILKAGTFVQEGADGDIEPDSKRILKRDDNESGQTYK